MFKRLLSFLCIAVAVFLSPVSSNADIEVYFLDVGQGDCAIITADGENMIIDGGPGSQSDKVYSYILNTLKLDGFKYMVATHPHEDHIGGLSAALIAVPVDTVLTPVLEWDSKAFRSMMQYADMRECRILVPYDGDMFPLGKGMVTVLLCWPEAVEYSSANDMSIVLRIDYGERSFLFTGDAEAYAEYMLVDAGGIEADVLKVAHHGSSTSCTEEFLSAVKPQYAVISCGKDNIYGHPKQETLDRLTKFNVTVLRTDLLGSVIFSSDGIAIKVHSIK